jgi:peptidoglycan hydrolase CwlO-like protein
LLNLLSEKSELEKLVQQLKSTIEQYEKDMNESKNNIFKLQNQFESSLVQKGQNESQFQG